jgi:hypothetical protein
MARIAVFVDHDITIRHFVLNGILSGLAARHDLVFVFPEAHKRVQTRLEALSLPRYRTLPISADRVYRYRRLYHASVLRKLRRTTDKRVGFKFWRDSLGTRAFLASWLSSWTGTHALYRAWVLSRVGVDEALERLLDEEQPDVILHPTVLEGLFVSDLVRAGEARRTPTVFVMNSWDNPAAKAMMVGYPDHLCVWGEQTRRHAVEHLRCPPERVVSLGAAQFDLYRRPPKVEPAVYRRSLGVPPTSKVLLYAGSSKGLNEIRHLVALEEAMEQGRLPTCVVLYRPHPWRASPEGEPEFHARRWTRVIMDPAMEASYHASRRGAAMRVDLADYEDTHVTLSAVDAVVSPLSTILLEAAMHGKPVAAYLPDEDMGRNRFLYTTANMAHFVDFFERVDCVRCESPEQLVQTCAQLLERAGDPAVSERLRKQCEYFVEPSERSFPDRLDALLTAILQTRGGRRPTEVIGT